jgi:hypothetical protein
MVSEVRPTEFTLKTSKTIGLNRTLLVGSVYRPPSTSVVYHLLGAQGYGLSALEEMCADILPGYGDVYLFGDFNVNLLDSSYGLFKTFCGFLESFRLYNVAISSTRAVSCKLLDLFLVSNKSEVVDSFQMPLSWSDTDMLFLSCRQQLPAVGVVERHVHSFKNIDFSGLLEVASGLDWNALRFISNLDSKVDYLYGLLSELIDVFAPVRTVKVGRSNSLSGIRHWMNRVKHDRNWLASADRRGIARSLLDARRSAFLSFNLDRCCVTNSKSF